MAARGDGELFRSREAQLYIEKGEESVLMQSGDFALVLVKNVVSQLAVVVAMVGAVQWPLGKDCAVTRTGEASFSFSLPGPLCYVLVLRSTSSAADLQGLEKVLEDYSTCSSPQHSAAAIATPAGGQEKEGSKQADKNVEIHSDVGQLRKRSGDDLSSEMEGRMQRARRMSAIAKVFSKSLERGAISVDNHVQPMDMATQDSQSSPLNFALAGVDAVAKVVEAVETGGRTLLESALSTAASEPASSVLGSTSLLSHGLSDLIRSGWTLNKHGLLKIYRVITASMAIHSGGSSRSGTSRSGSSSSSEFRRLLSSSSSSSSSSLSSKLPVTLAPHNTQVAVDARRADRTIVAALPPPAPSPCNLPPPPPFFAAYTPRVRTSDMPPPSGPVPSSGGPQLLDSMGSSSFRIYKPRPTPATASSTPPTGPPPFPPRPPRFQPPQS